MGPISNTNLMMLQMSNRRVRVRGIPPNAAHILNLDMSFWPKMDVDGQSRQAIEIFEAVVMFWRGRLGVVNPGA